MKLTSLILQYLLFMDPSIGLEYSLTTPQCTVFDSGSNIRPCNRVMHTDVPTADEVEQVKSFFGDRPFSWAVEVNDAHVRSLLESHQLSTRFSFPAMSIELDALQDQPCKADCTICAVDVHNDQELATFASIMATSFTADVSQVEVVMRTLMHKAVPDSIRLYLGYYQDEPAAVGMSLQHGSVVTIHWIGTLPAYRRKGLASALSYTALVDARHAGCTHAYLLASEAGKSLYERIGFTECARYAMYCNYLEEQQPMKNCNTTEMLSAWQPYITSIENWQRVVENITPRKTGCGVVYELPNPIERPNENFAIVDMSGMHFSEPHYHQETEVYFVLQGSGTVVVGGKEVVVQKGSAVIIPPHIAHFVIPQEDLVLAVVNNPPFQPESYRSVTEDDPAVQFDKEQFTRLAGL